MRIVKPGFALEERDEQRGGAAIIEKAARNCYKSEALISNGSAEKIIGKLIANGHEAMLEHGDYIFLLDDSHIYDNVLYSLRSISDMGIAQPRLHTTLINDRPIISGNIRAWRELFASASLAGRYFLGSMDPMYTQGFMDSDADPDPRVHQIFYNDLTGREQLVHERMTVRWIVDRGISHEIVRHRLASYAQESTRYANYAKEQFGSQITVIEPPFLQKGTDAWLEWQHSCETAEAAYFKILDIEGAPEKARTVLPTSLKTELLMTANLAEWKHFFALRALGKAGRPHPQMLEVAAPLHEALTLIRPDVFA